jgi:hypothetical protein
MLMVTDDTDSRRMEAMGKDHILQLVGVRLPSEAVVSAAAAIIMVLATPYAMTCSLGRENGRMAYFQTATVTTRLYSTSHLVKSSSHAVHRPREQLHLLVAAMVISNYSPKGTPDIIVKMPKISIQTRSQMRLVGIKLTAPTTIPVVAQLSFSLNKPSFPLPQLADAIDMPRLRQQQHFLESTSFRRSVILTPCFSQ